jgi:DNA polymerase III sliding clamp (beta) subunit (PCNA family)
MLTSLKFCAGSVARKDFVPELKHFHIVGGRVRGFNGTMALSSPISFDIDCKPNGEQLIKAVSRCEDTIQLSLTKAGRLSVKSGVFKAFVDCIESDNQHVQPEGDIVEFDGEVLLKAITTVSPFIGSDASRPWANGILIKGQGVFATNNVMLVECWIPTVFPRVVNLPRSAIREMLRIGEPPLYAQVADQSITFHYEGERWLRTQLYSANWPDLSKVLSRESLQQPIDSILFDGLDVIKGFTDKLGTVYFHENCIRTHKDELEGASFDIEGFTVTGKYNIDMLYLLKAAATTIDWTGYPGPCMFQGEGLRGAIIGMRQ